MNVAVFPTNNSVCSQTHKFKAATIFFDDHGLSCHPSGLIYCLYRNSTLISEGTHIKMQVGR